MAILDSKGLVLAGYLLAAYAAWVREPGAESLWLSDALRILDPCHRCGVRYRLSCFHHPH